MQKQPTITHPLIAMKTKVLFNSLIIFALGFLCSCNGETNGSDYNIMSFGAVDSEDIDNADAIQDAIDACSENGGGSVIFPAGKTFMSGPLHLRSNVDLHFEPGSRLLASPDESIYHESAFGENEGEGMMWLSGKDLENVSITGTGTIDGNGVAFMGAELDDSYELKPVTTFDPRPHVLTLINCKKINISDITITGSAYWTVHLVGCYDAAISDISLLNNLKIRNGDGIDLDHSQKVRITGCFIESGDDCICLKNRREYEEYGPCRDIVVTNCIMTSRSCAIKIGSENMDSIDHVLFDNCIIRNSNRGIGIQNRDEGTVSDVTFANMSVECLLHSDVWWGKAEPIYVTSYRRAPGNHKDAGWRFPKGAREGSCGVVSRINFINVSCLSENGCFISGETPEKVTDLTFRNVDIRLKKITTWPGGVYDKRPCDGEGFVNAPVYGFYIDGASDLTFTDCRIYSSDMDASQFGGDYKITNAFGIKK